MPRPRWFVWISANITEMSLKSDSQELSLQLYSLQEQARIDPVATLSSVQSLGFSAVETAGDYGWSLGKWQEQLKINKLKVSGAHVRLERLESELGTVVEFSTGIGNTHLIVPIPPEGEGADRYHACAERLNRAAAEAGARGCRLSYHNHHWEFEDLGNGIRGIDILVAETNPELVRFQIDTAWALAGGGDVLEFLKTIRGRVSCLHAKEYRMATSDEPTMGDGDVPFPEIIELALEEDWPIIVEHEPGGDAPEEVRASAAYLAELYRSAK